MNHEDFLFPNMDMLGSEHHSHLQNARFIGHDELIKHLTTKKIKQITTALFKTFTCYLDEMYIFDIN